MILDELMLTCDPVVLAVKVLLAWTTIMTIHAAEINTISLF